MKILEQTVLPTKYGEFQMIALESDFPDFPHIVLHTNKMPENNVLVRIHSECMTGDVFASSKCDCGEQLDLSLALLGKEKGILIYLRQEGRGIGLVNKMKAYNLQNQGFNTFEANVKLGFHQDIRNFDLAVDILSYLEITSIELITNNPDKLKVFDNTTIKVIGRRALNIVSNASNDSYLKAKKDIMGHLL